MDLISSSTACSAATTFKGSAAPQTTRSSMGARFSPWSRSSTFMTSKAWRFALFVVDGAKPASSLSKRPTASGANRAPVAASIHILATRFVTSAMSLSVSASLSLADTCSEPFFKISSQICSILSPGKCFCSCFFGATTPCTVFVKTWATWSTSSTSASTPALKSFTLLG